ncbi:MAG: hypothetical protein HQL05_09790 [Nitrospirae bacterium]|uniref:hypothetical protein n=1 Tax=Candidatus Magnetobacterium casense TaxID=1455061 RepID=UPI000695B039|nr:hypothetical protein [Candidatus Magnetobacterium casensis]MBF0338111.1 hypothetical protein [Nitrospirota bacterium]
MSEAQGTGKVEETRPIKSKELEVLTGPVGLDIGTTNIVIARMKGTTYYSVKQLNAFFEVPKSNITGKVLAQNDIMFFSRNGQLFIVGNSAEQFASTFNADTRRPIEGGLLSPKEDDGLNVIQAIIKTLLLPAKKQGEALCFSIPGAPIHTTTNVLYHEAVIKRTLEGMGYSPLSIHEGFAVVLSELADDSYTGIGISMGGGMCNICLSYLSVPVLTYSIQKGGDYIDTMAGNSLGEPATKIKLIKEKGLNLLKEPKNKLEISLHIFYEDLVVNLLQSIQQVMATSDRVPRFAKPLPIVLSGGTCLPTGCKELFEKVLKNIRLPIQISGVRIASDPLNTTARGALIMAMSEES